MPTIQIPKKLHRVLTTKARLIVVVGGRSSGKSEGIGRVMMMKAQTERADILCGRELQNSIDESVHKLLTGLVEKLDVQGANVLQNKIDFAGGGGFRYKGLARNPDAVKSAQDFKYSWIEEAQALSQKSIDDLLPTIRAEGSKLFFTANPQSSEDPFSKRFLVPFWDVLQRDGVYEDDMHLVILMNWRDNPWHGELEAQRQWDYDNLPRAKYDHVWEGAFNDSIEDALILSEWFDACIDAHIKLGWEPTGAKIAAHDPSDTGPDNKAYAARHGSLVFALEEKTTGDINEGGHWATGLAIQHQVHNYRWDCDGMGVGLNEQTVKAFTGTGVKLEQFKGSQAPYMPDAIYQHAGTQEELQKTNRDSFANQRAQFHFLLRDRIVRTFNAVTKGSYNDPDSMISFSSNLPCLSKLRSELCRIPVKPNANGKFALYSKDELKRKYGMQSPNLADAVMMLMKEPKQDIDIELPSSGFGW